MYNFIYLFLTFIELSLLTLEVSSSTHVSFGRWIGSEYDQLEAGQRKNDTCSMCLLPSDLGLIKTLLCYFLLRSKHAVFPSLILSHSQYPFDLWKVKSSLFLPLYFLSIGSVFGCSFLDVFFRSFAACCICCLVFIFSPWSFIFQFFNFVQLGVFFFFFLFFVFFFFCFFFFFLLMFCCSIWSVISCVSAIVVLFIKLKQWERDLCWFVFTWPDHEGAWSVSWRCLSRVLDLWLRF